jgi:hypothetical protein
MSANATAPDAEMRLCLSEMLRRHEDRTACAANDVIQHLSSNVRNTFTNLVHLVMQA